MKISYLFFAYNPELEADEIGTGNLYLDEEATDKDIYIAVQEAVRLSTDFPYGCLTSAEVDFVAGIKEYDDPEKYVDKLLEERRLKIAP